MNKPNDYKAIAWWGKMLQSNRFYVRDQQIKAMEMDAPLDAIFHTDKGWLTVSDLPADHKYRAALEEAMK